MGSRVERIEIPRKTSVANLYKVPVRQWRKWKALERMVFNELYSAMKDSPWAFSHPEQDKIPPRRWKTTAWNAAWIAADAVRDGQKEMLGCR